MEQLTSQINLGASGSVLSMSFNYQGTELALSSVDGTIQICRFSEERGWISEFISDALHQDTVNKVAWAHPQFGNILASCSNDKSILIWEGYKKKPWSCIAKLAESDYALYDIKFAPSELGLVLAACGQGSDFYIYHFLNELDIQDRAFYTVKTHLSQINSLSWNSQTSQFATLALAGSQDIESQSNQLQFWQSELDLKNWQEIDSGIQQIQSVLVVSWTVTIGTPRNLLAWLDSSGSVFVASFDEMLNKIDQICLDSGLRSGWDLQWDPQGVILSASTREGQVKTWKKAPGNRWRPNSQ